MQSIARILVFSSLLLMATLPIAVFRRGRPTAGWFVTAAPFGAAGLLVCAALAGGVRSSFDPRTETVLACLALAVLAAAVTLIVWTVRSHLARPALWHQPDDEPDVLVTSGPYAHVRHPFYAAFALLLVGTALAVPHPLSVAIVAVGVALLGRTARREEQRLLRSRFGAAYRAYMRRTGRLAPRLRPHGRQAAREHVRGS